MKKLILILFCFILPLISSAGVPPVFQPFVTSFVANGLIYGNKVNITKPKLTVQFGDLSHYGPNVIGLCQYDSRFMRLITLNQQFWNGVDNTQREILLFHELGHCSLARPHKFDLFKDGLFKSIMYPYIMGNNPYLNNYGYYQNELFTEKLEDNGIFARTYICGVE